MFPELYLFAYICFTIGSLVMLFGITRAAWYARFHIPKKMDRSIVLEEEDRAVSRNFTLLVPAFKEYEVIENTIDSIARLNYYDDRFQALLILDEKELIEKQRDAQIIIPAARQILEGRYSRSELSEAVRTSRMGMTDRDLEVWTEHYLKKAEVLAIAVLSRFDIDEGDADIVIPVAFSLLMDRPLREDVKGRRDFADVVRRVVELVNKVRSSPMFGDVYLHQAYEVHPFFETTIDVVKRLEKKYRPGLISHTIVPANYDGSYRNPVIMDHVVQSSKGRALNWGLNEVERIFPQTDIIGIYDSDGRPHPDVLAYINREMLSNRSKYVFYQGPIYLVRNYFDVHWVCKQSGLQSTSWHRILYPMMILRNQHKIIHFSGTNYFYTIHAIRMTDGYPPFHPTEDLGLAYDIYALRLEEKLPDLRIVPHPYEEIEQTTQSWRAWFRQQYRWSSGSPYQIKRLRQNHRISKKHRTKLVARLTAPLPVSIYAVFLGVLGLFLTTLALLGLGSDPDIPFGLDWFVTDTILIGFATFLATPEFIFLWSLKKGYLKTKGAFEVLINVVEILLTTIPYFIFAAFPIIYAWSKPLKGWGSKTPRTDERGRTKEEEYLRVFQNEVVMPEPETGSKNRPKIWNRYHLPR